MFGPRFEDRFEAGRVLAERLRAYAPRSDVTVLAVPRGGVEVASEVARILGAPLDVFIVRKLGTPGHEELAMGAIASGGVRVLNMDVIEQLAIPAEEVELATEVEERELARREHDYRGVREPLNLEGRIAILVDDGLATGSSMRAAVAGVREHGPARVVVAVPVASEEAKWLLEREADEVVCLRTPSPFHAVGLWFEDFEQVSDARVRQLLAQAARPEPAELPPPGP
ncbi:phosphoribosyltransferase [Myxococcaceae bacterium GXIMD 01537]